MSGCAVPLRQGFAAVALLLVGVAVSSPSSSAAAPATQPRPSVRVVDGVLRFHGTDVADVITYGQSGRRFEMLSAHPIDASAGCRRVPPGNGHGAFADTPYWVVCSHVQSTKWVLRGGDDQLFTSKFMPGLYEYASAPSVMLGGSGDDRLVGSFGHDVLNGGPGDDAIIGGRSEDLFVGGSGDDSLIVSGTRLQPPSGSPGETFRGGPGNDFILGDAGSDSLFGGPGDDEMRGGPGDDHFEGGWGADAMSGGGGSRDVLDYSARTAAVGVSDDGVANDGAPREGDNVMPANPFGPTSGMEIVETGSGNDTMSMTTPRARLHGNAGDDSLTMSGAQGAVFGGLGDDTLTISGRPGRLRGGMGDDALTSSDASADRDGCGPGTDDVTADASDVVNANCENVTVAP